MTTLIYTHITYSIMSIAVCCLLEEYNLSDCSANQPTVVSILLVLPQASVREGCSWVVCVCVCASDTDSCMFVFVGNASAAVQKLKIQCVII